MYPTIKQYTRRYEHDNELPQMEYEQQQQLHSESSNHFCFRPDECGYLKEHCIRDRLEIMVRKEREMYNYDRFLPGHEQSNSPRPNPMLIVDTSWRADIVKWTYNVVSRELFFVSLTTMICKNLLSYFPYRWTILICQGRWLL